MTETELQELRAERENLIGPFIEKMRTIADTNNYGFVTTDVGSEFRAIVEFGHQACHVVSTEGHDMENICAGLSMKEERVRERAQLVRIPLCGMSNWAVGS